MQKQYDEICKYCLDRLLETKAIRQFDELSDDQLQTFFSNFYYIVGQFPRQLGLLIFNAPNNDALFTLGDNLVDELGGADKLESLDFSGLHVNLLGGLMKGLGFTDNDLHSITPLTETQKYIDFLNEGYLNKPFIESIAYIAAGMEAIFPEIAKRMYNVLSARFTDEQLIHFKEHMVADVKHDEQLRKMIYPLLEDEGALALFEKGAKEVAEYQVAMLDAFVRD
ncbi:iron-containing redox enzyme family protein [Pleionea sediminis]|uniref:iron-containing redox enzyme family protein n=1 Tax=Pleionea sediminis TaxID=2569479 RepID=UPI001184834E|nr:iron-containing redox enzyme family protein [Pleionea sediminis]